MTNLAIISGNINRVTIKKLRKGSLLTFSEVLVYHIRNIDAYVIHYKFQIIISKQVIL